MRSLESVNLLLGGQGIGLLLLLQCFLLGGQGIGLLLLLRLLLLLLYPLTFQVLLGGLDVQNFPDSCLLPSSW